MIVIRHRNETYKSTPFQAVFSERAMKARESKKSKLKELQLLVNDELVDLPMRIDPNNGRVHFQKVRPTSLRSTSAKLGPFLIAQTFLTTTVLSVLPRMRRDSRARILRAKPLSNSRTNRPPKTFGNSPGCSAVRSLNPHSSPKRRVRMRKDPNLPASRRSPTRGRSLQASHCSSCRCVGSCWRRKEKRKRRSKS